MGYERLVAGAFRMDERTWARHANSWSVYTRIATLPVVLLALWSRVWLGWWSLALIAAVVVWVWVNPRLFPAPRSTDNWAAKVTFGERVWLGRRERAIPPRHRVFPHVLNGIAAAGIAVALWGAYALAVWPTVLGTVLVYAGKLWFCDRMVWLFEDMRRVDPELDAWVVRREVE